MNLPSRGFGRDHLFVFHHHHLDAVHVGELISFRIDLRIERISFPHLERRRFPGQDVRIHDRHAIRFGHAIRSNRIEICGPAHEFLLLDPRVNDLLRHEIRVEVF